MYNILALVFAIIINNRPTYLNSTQNTILKTLSENFINDKLGTRYTSHCCKLVNFVQEERLDKLRNQVKVALLFIRLFFFLIPYIALNYIFWNYISYVDYLSFKFLYLLIIVSLCLGFAFIYDFFHLSPEKEFVDGFEMFDSAKFKQRCEQDRSREERIQQERILRDRELREKYL